MISNIVQRFTSSKSKVTPTKQLKARSQSAQNRKVNDDSIEKIEGTLSSLKSASHLASKIKKQNDLKHQRTKTLTNSCTNLNKEEAQITRMSTENLNEISKFDAQNNHESLTNRTTAKLFYSNAFTASTSSNGKQQIIFNEFISKELKQQSLMRFADESEYRMNNLRRGIALIINNKRFDPRLDMPVREGTDRDAACLEFTLSKLGFDLKIAHNCTASFMRELLFKWARADHSDNDCFVCIIMTHGDEGVVYGVDKSIELDLLIQPFKQNKTLAGKPKLFFVQACRGSNFMEGIDSNPFEVNYVNRIPMEADFLFAYSTVAGHYSWRNSTNGSWFIQSLCQVLDEHGKQLEIMQLLTAVNRRVAYYYESNTNDPEMSGKRQGIQ